FRLWSAVALAATLASVGCTRARTEIVLHVDTDMTQGAGGELPSIRLRAFGDTQGAPSYDQVLELGGATSLPTMLGLLRGGSDDALVTVMIDALGDDGSPRFTKTVAAHYVPGRTLLLDAFLAGRCTDPAAQQCADGQSCGSNGCEGNLRSNLPDYN